MKECKEAGKCPEPEVPKPDFGFKQIPLNCDSVCLNYGRKMRAPIAVEGSFEKGDTIVVCQICKNYDHLKTPRKRRTPE